MQKSDWLFSPRLLNLQPLGPVQGPGRLPLPRCAHVTISGPADANYVPISANSLTAQSLIYSMLGWCLIQV
jgi:hypothetical protein